MAHAEQTDFVRRAAARFPGHFHKACVLEVGSRNVNGTVRDLFSGCDYTGIDCVAGRDVDVVCLAHEFIPVPSKPKPGETFKGIRLCDHGNTFLNLPLPFDTVVSCEAFEHDPYIEKTLPSILSALRPGGLFVATWAAPARMEHGTRRSRVPEDAGQAYGPDPDYYRGLSVEEVVEMCGGLLTDLEGEYARGGVDAFLLGFRAARG